MAMFAIKYCRDPQRVAEVGAYIVTHEGTGGTFRDIFGHCEYTGLDISDGPGVDRVISLDNFGDDQFDVVISGSTIEHVQDMQEFAEQCIRITRPGGLLCVIGPHGMSGFDEHFHPLDCWRIWPDGMKWLFRTVEVLECRRDTRDTVLIARKPL